MRRPHRRKPERWAPIDGVRLKNALAAARPKPLSIAAAARALQRRGVGVVAATLSLLVRGVQRKCDPTVFGGLVRLLRGAIRADRFAVYLSGGDIEPGATTLDAVAYAIVAQDGAEFSARAERDRGARRPGREHEATGWLQTFYHPGVWRERLLDGPVPTTVADIDAAARHASAFLHVVLQPWRKDRRVRLHPDALHRLAQLFDGVLPVTAPAPRSPTDLEALRRAWAERGHQDPVGEPQMPETVVPPLVSRAPGEVDPLVATFKARARALDRMTVSSLRRLCARTKVKPGSKPQMVHRLLAVEFRGDVASPPLVAAKTPSRSRILSG